MKKYLLSFVMLLSGIFLLSSCMGDEEPRPSTPQEFTVTLGAFVLNEGNYYNNINGSLSYIDLQQSTISNGLFHDINNRYLGATPNSMVVAGDNSELYIACTDDNRIEITDNKLKSIASIDIEKPREMVVSGGYVYVTSYSGTVAQISTISHKITATSEVVGKNLEGIAVRGDYLYVCNSYNPDYTYNNNVIKLKTSTLEKVGDITVATNPTTIKADGNNLYLLSSGNYQDIKPQIQKIDSEDKVTFLCNGLFFDVYNENLFVVDSTVDKDTQKTLYSYFAFTKTGSKLTIIPPFDIPAPCAINVDPNTGALFVSSNKMGENGYPDYSATGYVYAFSLDGTYYKRYDAGVGPYTLMFNHVKYITQ